MAQVRKLHGQFPENVVVLSEVVEFDAEGFAEVSDEVYDTLAQIPGYEILAEKEDAEALKGQEADNDGGGKGDDPNVSSTSSDSTEGTDEVPEGTEGTEGTEVPEGTEGTEEVFHLQTASGEILAEVSKEETEIPKKSGPSRRTAPRK